MLVVLVIIAVMAGVAVLGLGSLGRGNRAEAEARRLADRLQLASDEVLVAGAPLAMRLGLRRLPVRALGRQGGGLGAERPGAARSAARAARGAEAGAGRGGRHTRRS